MKSTTKTPKPQLYYELSDIHREITYLHLPAYSEQPEGVQPDTFQDAYRLGQDSALQAIREILRNRAMKALEGGGD